MRVLTSFHEGYNRPASSSVVVVPLGSGFGWLIQTSGVSLKYLSSISLSFTCQHISFASRSPRDTDLNLSLYCTGVTIVGSTLLVLAFTNDSIFSMSLYVRI